MFRTTCALILSSCLGACSLVTPTTSNPDKGPMHLVWSQDLDPAYSTGNLPIALNSPLVHDGLVFVGHNGGEMHAYDANTGRLIWAQEDSGTYHSVPSVFQDHVIYGTVEGRVYSRNFLTGQLKYSVDLGAPVETEGVMYKGRAFFHLRNHQIFALDASSGKILWGHKRSVPFMTTLQRASAPAFVDNKLIVGLADGVVVALSLEDGSLLWERKVGTGAKFVDVDVRPVVWEKMVLVGPQGGALMALDPNTGNILHQLDIQLSRIFLPINGPDKDKLLVGDVHGDLLKVDNKLTLRSRTKVSNDAITGLVPWKDKLVVTTAGRHVLLISPKDFSKVSSFDMGHVFSSVLGTASEDKGKLAVLSSRHHLYIFE